MTYYSVDRHGACAAGKHFHLDPCGVPARNATAVDHINTLYPDGFSPHGAMYYRDAIDNLATTVGDFTCSADYLSALIELLLETTRQAHYPHKPSRYQSMYAWDSLSDAHRFRKKCGVFKSPIYVLHPQAQVHRGDMSLYALQGSMANIDRRMHLYWQGKTLGQADHIPQWEHVLELPVIVGAREG